MRYRTLGQVRGTKNSAQIVSAILNVVALQREKGAQAEAHATKKIGRAEASGTSRARCLRPGSGQAESGRYKETGFRCQRKVASAALRASGSGSRSVRLQSTITVRWSEVNRAM